MGPVYKQDVQNIVETAKNRIMERVALRQDVQSLTDCIKNMMNLLQQNQQYLRNAEFQRSQMTRRVIALETRIGQLEQEIHGYRGALNKVADAKPQQIVMPVTPVKQEPQQDYSGQYVYRPI